MTRSHQFDAEPGNGSPDRLTDIGLAPLPEPGSDHDLTGCVPAPKGEELTNVDQMVGVPSKSTTVQNPNWRLRK